MLNKAALFLAMALLPCAALAEMPEFYRSVAEVHWVVADLDQVTREWARLGFQPVESYGEVELAGFTVRGAPAAIRVRAARGLFGDLPVIWIQPLGGRNVYTDFLQRRGSGIISLVHSVPSLEALEQELERLGKLGMGILQRGTVENDGGVATYAYMDTEGEGKYVLGLVHDAVTATSPASEASGLRNAQLAFVVKDMRPVSAYWEKLGLPAFSYTHPPLTELTYRGKPGEFDQELGWQRHGTVVYEWIVPLRGPTVYAEFLEKHGEGFHHLALNVPDMDKALEYWKSLGVPCAQSGSWGEKGKPGSGRFAYMETDAAGGVMLELLWNYRETAR